MVDEPRHKSSVELDKQLAEEMKKGQITPALMLPIQLYGTLGEAFDKAQEAKERFLGRLPPLVEPQPNVAISKWKHDWATAHMNNTRDLGPGDVKK
jgi:hypothetical protein